MLLSGGFSLILLAFYMWIVKMVWRIDKNVKSLDDKLSEMLSKHE